jgi:hypothetical protein
MQFTSVRIMEQKTMIRLLKDSIMPKPELLKLTIVIQKTNLQTQALTADNSYSEDQFADIFLPAVDSTSKSLCFLIINIHAKKRANW